MGISYAVLSYAVSPLSGGQLNPVVTLAQAFSGHTHFATAGLYIVAQAGLNPCVFHSLETSGSGLCSLQWLC